MVMTYDDLNNPSQWAQQQFANVNLGDSRRTARAVKLGTALTSNPNASLPNQLQTWHDLKAAYRFLASKDVNFQAICKPHWEHTRNQARALGKGVVLFIQDGSELDFSSLKATENLGLIGNTRGGGLMLHSCLALNPQDNSNAVIGMAHQSVWKRTGVIKGTETRTQRAARRTEYDVWAETLEAIGDAPNGDLEPIWLSVSDRGSDLFSFVRRAKAKNWHCLLRSCQDRAVQTDSGQTRLFSLARSLPARGKMMINKRGRDGQIGHEIELNVAWGPVQLLAPKNGAEKNQAAICGWCVRAWESSSSSGEGTPLEWILFSTLCVERVADALDQLAWYAMRWIIEEYHKALKTGCAMELRQLGTADGLERLLGFLTVVAVRLLQMRCLSRSSPDLLAENVIEPVALEVIAARLGVKPALLTVCAFWHGVAGLGGFLGRKSDGDPGWQTLWRGWFRLQDMCWSAGLAVEHRRI